MRIPIPQSILNQYNDFRKKYSKYYLKYYGQIKPRLQARGQSTTMAIIEAGLSAWEDAIGVGEKALTLAGYSVSTSGAINGYDLGLIPAIIGGTVLVVGGVAFGAWLGYEVKKSIDIQRLIDAEEARIITEQQSAILQGNIAQAPTLTEITNALPSLNFASGFGSTFAIGALILLGGFLLLR